MIFKSWILAFRPKTLTAAVIPIIVGTSLVHFLGYSVQWWISGFALLSSLFIQIGTNLVNDALDFKKGADTHLRIGPQRVTQSGLIEGRTVMISAFVCFFFALVLGVPLVIHGGLPILAIGIVSLFCAYGYTGGPFPLAYRGLGDVFVILFFGLIAVSGLIFLQTHQWPAEALLSGLQIGSLATVLIAINNLRDREGDEKVHKRTLAVRLGPQGARIEILVLCFLPFVLNLYWMTRGSWLIGLFPMLSLPLAVSIVRKIFQNEPGPLYNQYLGKAAALHSVFGILMCAGMWMA